MKVSDNGGAVGPGVAVGAGRGVAVGVGLGTIVGEGAGAVGELVRLLREEAKVL